MKWLPIESAPKDDRRVMVFGPDGIDIGQFVEWSLGPGWQRPLTAEYDNEMADISTPTHWMPLPKPPQ